MIAFYMNIYIFFLVKNFLYEYECASFKLLYAVLEYHFFGNVTFELAAAQTSKNELAERIAFDNLN